MQNFEQLGRREAIRLLFDGSGFEPFSESCFVPEPGRRVAGASRLFLEGIDFDLVYFPLKHLGYKAVTVATGALYASMAMPRTLSVVLGVSAKLNFDSIRELWSGALQAASEFGYESVGLDIQPSQNGLSIAVSCSGCIEAGERPAPASKDLLCVTGALGAAYCGLRILERGRQRYDGGIENIREALEKHKMLVAAYLKPELPAGLPAQLSDAGISPSASVFVDRGLADAMLRLRESTGLGVKAYADRIPFESGTFALGKEMDFDPVSAAMNGGEDCRVLFSVPIDRFDTLRHEFQAFDIIGHLALPEAGAVLVDPSGLEHKVSAPGWPDTDIQS